MEFRCPSVHQVGCGKRSHWSGYTRGLEQAKRLVIGYICCSNPRCETNECTIIVYRLCPRTARGGQFLPLPQFQVVVQYCAVEMNGVLSITLYVVETAASKTLATRRKYRCRKLIFPLAET